MSAPAIVQQTRDAASGQPGEQTEVRQVMPTEDAKPNPANSIKLPANRQKLVDDVIDLYSMKPTVEKVSRYTPNCVYDDQFVYANNRFKMACQWYALTYLFKESRNESYEIIKNEPNLIQFKNEQTWVFLGINKEVTINAIVSLSIDPPTADSDFPLISYHKDQANEKDYSHEGIGFIIKKAQADLVPKLMSREEVMFFKADDLPDKPVVKHGSGTNAPLKDL